MNIGILSRSLSLYSTKRLYEAAINRGHKVEIIDTLKCSMEINSKAPMVHYLGRPLDYFDAVIPRIGASITFYGTAVVRQFEMMGVISLNESVAISRARDKLRSLQILSRIGLGMPITGFAHSSQLSQELIKLVGGAPLVIKLLEGTQGKGVVLAETEGAALSVIDAFLEMNANVLVQEFIKEAKGADYRLLVVGNEVVGAIKREAKPGEFRSNLHRGGKALCIQPTPNEIQLALKASRALGLEVAGVDLLRSERGPLIMEVNSSPGLNGIETATSLDVAGKMIEHLEVMHANRHSQNKVNG